MARPILDAELARFSSDRLLTELWARQQDETAGAIQRRLLETAHKLPPTEVLRVLGEYFKSLPSAAPVDPKADEPAECEFHNDNPFPMDAVSRGMRPDRPGKGVR